MFIESKEVYCLEVVVDDYGEWLKCKVCVCFVDVDDSEVDYNEFVVVVFI